MFAKELHRPWFATWLQADTLWRARWRCAKKDDLSGSASSLSDRETRTPLPVTVLSNFLGAGNGRTRRGERCDRAGIIASTACAVHCMAGAAFAASAGALRIFADERMELGFVVVATTIAVVSIGLGFRRHRARAPSVLVGVGLVTLGLAKIVSGRELGLSIAGAALLVLAHAMNLGALRRARECC